MFMFSLKLQQFQVFLPAIVGRVPPQMVRAIRYFLDFCYLVRKSVLDDNDLDKLDECLAINIMKNAKSFAQREYVTHLISPNNTH